MFAARWCVSSALRLLPLALALALLTAAAIGPADEVQDSQPSVAAAPFSSAPARIIRVLLSSGQRELSIGAEGAIAILAADGSRLGEAKPPIKLSSSGGEVKAAGFKGASLILQPAKGFLSFGGNRYRGGFRVQGDGAGGLLLINLVDVEDYLRGVVPAEMPALWHPEAVKAQAVAARTYVLQRAQANRGRAYDVVGTVGDQMYGGVAREHPAADAAIKATEGMVITYDGSPIVAYYHSCCGGQTRNGEYPYLVSVPSPEESPYDSWELSYTFAEFGGLLTAAGHRLGALQSVIVSPPDARDPTCHLEFRGDAGKVQLTPAQVRKLIGLNVMRSPSFTVELVGRPGEGLVDLEEWKRAYVISADGVTEMKMRNSVLSGAGRAEYLRGTQKLLERVSEAAAVRFAGGGYGHGVGMSQYGAKYMAEHGASWRQIVQHYYTGVEIQHIGELGRERMPGL
jgi:stage II sporulation protein D